MIFFPSKQDWFVPSPALPIPEGGLALNKDQIRETLNYFRKYQIYYFLLQQYLRIRSCEISHSISGERLCGNVWIRNDHDICYIIIVVIKICESQKSHAHGIHKSSKMFLAGAKNSPSFIVDIYYMINHHNDHKASIYEKKNAYICYVAEARVYKCSCIDIRGWK